MSIRVLVADDDLDFLDVTAYALRRAGFEVETASSGGDALRSWQKDAPDVILLDVNMAENPGIEVCQTIRAQSSIPVILMSGNRRESEIVRGFRAGADDYITKPFSPQHLVMRLQAIHKRVSGHVAEVTPRHIVLPPLVIDLDSFLVMIDGEPVRLTRLEFRLLYCLAANIGRIVSTSRLIDFAYGLDGEGDVSLLKTHFSHIRRKIAEVSDYPLTIRALAGAGYGMYMQP